MTRAVFPTPLSPYRQIVPPGSQGLPITSKIMSFLPKNASNLAGSCFFDNAGKFRALIMDNWLSKLELLLPLEGEGELALDSIPTDEPTLDILFESVLSSVLGLPRMTTNPKMTTKRMIITTDKSI